MNRLTLLVAVSLSATMLAVSAAAGDGSKVLSPGPLHQGHANATCGECHEPWAGVTDERCLNCHEELEDAGNDLHKDLAARCTECHLDHRGPDASITFSIDHGALDDASERCAECHEALLEEVFGRRGHWTESCGDCHSTEDWGSVDFDHDEYFPLRSEGHYGLDCVDCHPDSRATGFEGTTCSSRWGCHPSGTLEAWKRGGGGFEEHEEEEHEEEEHEGPFDD